MKNIFGVLAMLLAVMCLANCSDSKNKGKDEKTSPSETTKAEKGDSVKTEPKTNVSDEFAIAASEKDVAHLISIADNVLAMGDYAIGEDVAIAVCCCAAAYQYVDMYNEPGSGIRNHEVVTSDPKAAMTFLQKFAYLYEYAISKFPNESRMIFDAYEKGANANIDEMVNKAKAMLEVFEKGVGK